MEKESEKQAVEEAKKDPAAFGVIFEAYYPAILRYALHRTGNAAVADDVTSEVFFKALNKLSTFKWSGVPFSAWLYRIAGNEIIKAQDQIDNNTNFLKVKEALKTLPVKYQEVLVLRFLEDNKIFEIAQVLGKSEGTIKSLISRGIAD